MGASAIARCLCGYESPLLMIGGGMLNFNEFCAFPAYCAEGSHLVTVNMFDRPLACPDGHKSVPVPYNAPSLQIERGDAVVVSWNLWPKRTIQLTNGRYLCPTCHEARLSFSDGGVLWD